MSFSFDQRDSSVQDGLRRIALDQMDSAIGEIDDSGLDEHETVHQVRKRCKKLRGLIRLVRPAFADYSAENVAFRDAARSLSFLRDSEALIATYDGLLDHYGDAIERPALASVRRRLTLRQKAAVREHDLDAALESFRRAMQRARRRAAKWSLDQDGFGPLAAGLAKTYGRARKAMARARNEGTAEAIHEWRKRVKYHWYHARLLAPMWQGPIKAYAQAAHRLSDLLGDHHDLAVMRQTVTGDPDAFGKPDAVEVFLGLVGRRQAELAAESMDLGERLLAETPAALVERWSAYWTAWRG